MLQLQKQAANGLDTDREQQLREALGAIEYATANLDTLCVNKQTSEEELVKGKEALRDAVELFQKRSGCNASRLGVELEVSDQTVYRWRNTNPKDSYFKTRPNAEVIERWHQLIRRLVVPHTHSLQDLGLWVWQDLVALDDDAETRRVWVYSSNSFGESASREECAKLLRRVTDPKRSVAYIYVFPEGSKAADSYQVIHQYCQDYLKSDDTISGYVIGVSLPNSPGLYQHEILYADTQTVLYENANYIKGFLALPYDEEIARDVDLNFGLLWKRMPVATTDTWNLRFFSRLWQLLRPHLDSLVECDKRGEHSTKLDGGGSVHVALCRQKV